MEIGQRIATIRKEKGIKQVDLAKSIGLSKNGLQKIEYGDVTPKATTIHKIAKALGVLDIDLDDGLKEMVEKWNEENDVQKLSSESQFFDTMISLYGHDISSTFNDFLSLTDEGQQKASEYIDLLMQKYKK
ncbi:MAG: helix-turn-helix transcriptional regulator [Candidatus Cloacimonetes bacterium]|nr:helix-turn-helix transcriptional regulator [Candidatus Cloacimonadota bacterium]